MKKDLLGEVCKSCALGWYKETSVMDDINGVLHCMNCHIKVDRYVEDEDLVFRLKERARIRRQIDSRKSVQEGKPDRIADLLEEAAEEIARLEQYEFMYKGLEK